MLLNDKLKPYRLLLASQSPRRRELMTGCGLPYELAENSTARRPILTTFRLSAFRVPLDAQKRSLSGSVARKRHPAHGRHRRAGRRRIPDDGRGYDMARRGDSGQTRDRDDARRMLKILSGAHHLVTTGVTLRLPRG